MESERAVLAEDGIGRIFIACKECQRVMPHYRAYGPKEDPTSGMCKCGGVLFRPTVLPEWKAAWWVLVRGWLIRKKLQKKELWDPRMPTVHL